MAPRAATLFVLITVFIDMVGMGLVWPVLPRLIEEVSGSDLADASIWGGWLFVAYAGMQFLFGPALGNLSDAFGRRPILLLSVFGMGIDYVITAVAPNLIWLFIGRILAGICGASYTIAYAYLTDITPVEGRARAFGIMGAAFGLGFIVGPAIGGLLGEFGPRVPFMTAAALSLANFALGYFVLPETLARDLRRPFSLARCNPLATLKVFASYRGVLPMGFVMLFYYLATSVYSAIWPFWGIARFGWSEAMIGLTLAAFGLVMAIVQGGLTGPAVKWLRERNATIFGLATAVIAAAGYGLAPNLTIVLILYLVHAPEGFVQPALTALMTKEAPDDAQGELQGGIASLQNIGMIAGTLLFAMTFGWFMKPNPIIVSPNVGYFLSAAILTATLAYFMVRVPKAPPTRP
ncbi:MAG: TCR/Tet family MFS transporter [Alphaproteobacteria bacterium]|nr:TCR/Tet family MFS transporter [Alphaproteobacteria bacterium]